MESPPPLRLRHDRSVRATGHLVPETRPLPGADPITLAERQPHKFPGPKGPRYTAKTRATEAADFGYSHE